MNQRSRNRSSHATMLGCELVQRSNSRRLAQHYGYLTSTGNAFRLPRGTGLWFGHGLLRRVLGVVAAHSFRAPFRHFAGRPTGKRLAINAHKERAVSLFSDRDRSANPTELFNALGFHWTVLSGPIPPMSESYVTSNTVSTTILQVAA